MCFMGEKIVECFIRSPDLMNCKRSLCSQVRAYPTFANVYVFPTEGLPPQRRGVGIHIWGVSRSENGGEGVVDKVSRVGKDWLIFDLLIKDFCKKVLESIPLEF